MNDEEKLLMIQNLILASGIYDTLALSAPYEAEAIEG